MNYHYLHEERKQAQLLLRLAPGCTTPPALRPKYKLLPVTAQHARYSLVRGMFWSPSATWETQSSRLSLNVTSTGLPSSQSQAEAACCVLTQQHDGRPEHSTGSRSGQWVPRGQDSCLRHSPGSACGRGKRPASSPNVTVPSVMNKHVGTS